LCDGKQLEKEAYVALWLCVNVGADFLPCPVHVGVWVPRGSLTPPPCVLEARLRNFPGSA